MSGPKVIRVVTREELAMRCQAAMGTLRAAASEYKASTAVSGEDSAAASDALAALISDIESHLANLRVDGLEARIQAQTAFLQKESGRMRALARQRAEHRRQGHRRTIDTARALARSLGESPLVNELMSAINAAKSLDEQAIEVLRTVTASAYEEFRRSIGTQSASTADGEMARRLLAGEDVTLSEWAATNAKGSRQVDRLERLIMQIQMMGGDVAAFAERASDLALLEESSTKAARVDSLLLEVGEAAARAKHVESVRARAAAAQQTLRALQVGSGLVEALVRAGAGKDEQHLETLVAQAERAVVEHLSESAANSRRRAVLDGLKALGYVIQDSLETALVKDGRVVVSRPDDGDYGVELGATPDAQSMQVRLVGVARPSRPRSPERDTDVERKWCTDFEKLRGAVAKAGAEITIRKALGVGVQAVKTVENGDLQRAQMLEGGRAGSQNIER